MALKVLDCARVLPQGGCSLTLIGEPEEVLSAYAHHLSTRRHLVEYVEPGREPENQLHNYVSLQGSHAYIGDDYEHLSDGSLHVPGPGVLAQRFGPGSTTLTCQCTPPATGTCLTTVSTHYATCTNATCTSCAFFASATGLYPDREFLPEFAAD